MVKESLLLELESKISELGLQSFLSEESVIHVMPDNEESDTHTLGYGYKGHMYDVDIYKETEEVLRVKHLDFLNGMDNVQVPKE